MNEMALDIIERLKASA